MFFASYEFLFLFLPVVLAGFALLRRAGLGGPALHWLIGASLLFYWSLDDRHLPVLLVSVGSNYAFLHLMQRAGRAGSRLPGLVLWAAIGFNVALLLCLKYVFVWTGHALPADIPLGISFFTVQQIAFACSHFNERPERVPPLSSYLLFVCFFPYVVAGPIVTRGELLEQIERVRSDPAGGAILASFTLFSLGLFKKVVIADGIGIHVDHLFGAAGNGTALSFADAWSAALLYTLQIYFDFSGYSDMAAGLAGLFGFRLPRNFHSPLKATSIMDFWRRWHITATRFFTNHVYLPLVLKLMRRAVRWRLAGVSRFVLTVLLPMLVTFFLIGIWHGAGMTAVVFGLLMGCAIAVNHTWSMLSLPRFPKALGWLLTMFVVVCGMVFSRADTLTVAADLLAGMFGLGGTDLPGLDRTGIALWLALAGALAVFAPNTHEIMERAPVVLKESWDAVSSLGEAIRWREGAIGVVVTSLVFSSAAVLLPKAAQFIYYRF